MGEPRKVVYVDFTGKKKAGPLRFGGGPGSTLLVFSLVLAAVVVWVAIFAPAWLFSAFFAPTAIVISVLAALGFRRAAIAFTVRRMYSEMKQDKGGTGSGSSPDRILH